MTSVLICNRIVKVEVWCIWSLSTLPQFSIPGLSTQWIDLSRGRHFREPIPNEYCSNV